MADETIKILLAQNYPLFTKGLENLLSKEFGYVIVDIAIDSKDAINKTSSLKPNVILMDLMLPPVGGISTTRKILKLKTNTELIILSPYENNLQLRDAFQAGAKSFLTKGSSYEELLQAISHTSRGEYYLSGIVGRDLVLEYIKYPLRENSISENITQREREIACLLANGYSTKEVASLLDISTKTAETHRNSIMKKLKARNVTDIVKYCIRMGLIEA